jgi:hypothetical protein
VDEIERQAMEFLLRGDNAVLAVLRDQLAATAVATRHLTGVGFFTGFHVPATAPRLPWQHRIVIADVYAEVMGLEYGAGFVLFIEKGILDTLECFIFEDAWPQDPKLTRLYYVRPAQPGERRLSRARTATSIGQSLQAISPLKPPPPVQALPNLS